MKDGEQASAVPSAASRNKEETTRSEVCTGTSSSRSLGIWIRVLNAISHPGPTHGLRVGKGRAAPPRLGFPLGTPFRGAPSTKGIPKGGHPSRPRRLFFASLRSRGRGLGGGSRDHGPPGRPSGHALCRSTPSASRPALKGFPIARVGWRPSVASIRRIMLSINREPIFAGGRPPGGADGTLPAH